MRLVHQKDIIAIVIFRKKSPQIYVRVKRIIVITDNPVREQTHIQAKFKRTYLMLSCILLYHFSGKACFMCQ